MLIVADDGGRLFEGEPAAGIASLHPGLFRIATELVPQPCKVFESSQYACYAFMILCAGFELVWQLIRGRTHLVSLKLVKQIVFPIQRTGMRTKEFVGGTHQEITA